MQFYDYRPLYAVYKRARAFEADEMPWDAWYLRRRSFALAMNDNAIATQMGMEYNWYLSKRPYYNIWPAIIPPLLKLNLALDSTYLRPPKSELLLRLPTEKNPVRFGWRGEKYTVQTILMAKLVLGKEMMPGVGIWIDFGEVMGIQPILTYQNLKCEEGLSLEDEVRMLPRRMTGMLGVQMTQECLENCLRLCATMCLLENDPSVVTADVLNKDKQKFEDTGDDKYVQKAHRQGKIGWNIGQAMTVSPHVRVPHTALFWTGKGRTIPVVKIRAGSIIHRSKVENIPTGHLGTEDK